ncbi:hypothetical protein HDU89_007707 [Geranomyces variabilis]|nr:hypothetical protein HDU89_007707 [Geranomyces variabilis]
MSTEAPAPAVIFKRGKRPAKQLQQKRTRPIDDSDSDGDDDSTTLADAASVAKKLRGGKPSAAFTSSTGGSAAAKRRKEAAAAEIENSATAGISKLDHAYSTSGKAASIVVDSATRRLDVDGEESTAAGSEGALPPPPKVLAGDAAESADNIYRGLNSYNEYVNKRTTSVTQSNASRIRAGPLRGATNVRLSTRFDYQPDICKDYKETGYCGFGDSCIFMHDRGDYKTGWQLDKEWDEKQKAGAAANDKDRFLIRSDDEDENDGSGSDDDLPFACVICRNEFKDPIVTKCGHYFCESCALKQHSKSVKCFICGAATQGLFKPASDIQAKITAKKKRIAEREAEIRAQNGDIEIESD